VTRLCAGRLTNWVEVPSRDKVSPKRAGWFWDPRTLLSSGFLLQFGAEVKIPQSYFSFHCYFMAWCRMKCRISLSLLFANLILAFNRETQELEQGKTYKYVGIEESEGVHQQMKERLKKEYTKRLRMY
jgi:hypothetical protein